MSKLIARSTSKLYKFSKGGAIRFFLPGGEFFSDPSQNNTRLDFYSTWGVTPPDEPYKNWFSTKRVRSAYELLRSRYIEALENPNKIGYDEVKDEWTCPTLKGYDKKLIGVGLDTVKNKFVRDFLEKNKRTKKPYLTNDEMLDLLSLSFKYFEDVLDRHLKNTSISDTKRAVALGILYHGHGNKLWNPQDNKSRRMSRAFFNGSDREFINAVTDFYDGRNSVRSEAHANFWK